MTQQCEEMLIRVVPDAPEIAIEQVTGAIIRRKLVSPETLARCLLESKFDDSLHFTGLMPDGCIAMSVGANVKHFFIRCPELRADFSYYGTEYRDFPIPRMVFGFRYLVEEGKVAGCSVCVTKDERLTYSTPTYFYPFSNVSSGSGSICIGNNTLPVYKDPVKLSTLPSYILRIPNNDDHYSSEHNRLGLGYRDLLELMKDKEPADYYRDVLVPNGKTLKDFIGGAA